MTPGVLVPCLTCGEPSEEPRCAEHRASKTRERQGYRERGYTGQFDRLSRRARRLQPFCMDCGTTTNLTTDHLPSAWARQAEGLPIRLRDVEVCCRDCNTRRGSSRPGSRRYDEWEASRAT